MPRGYCFVSAANWSSVTDSLSPFAMLVCTSPGQTQLTLILSAASSRARAFANEISAPFEAAYAASAGCGLKAIASRLTRRTAEANGELSKLKLSHSRGQPIFCQAGILEISPQQPDIKPDRVSPQVRVSRLKIAILKVGGETHFGLQS